MSTSIVDVSAIINVPFYDRIRTLEKIVDVRYVKNKKLIKDKNIIKKIENINNTLFEYNKYAFAKFIKHHQNLIDIFYDPATFDEQQLIDNKIKRHEELASMVYFVKEFCGYLLFLYETNVNYHKIKNVTISIELYNLLHQLYYTEGDNDDQIMELQNGNDEFKMLYNLICDTFNNKVYSPSNLKHSYCEDFKTNAPSQANGFYALENVYTKYINTIYKKNLPHYIVTKSGTGTGKSIVLSMLLIYRAPSKKTLILSPRIQSVEDNSGFISKILCTPHGTLVGFKHSDLDMSKNPRQKLTFRTQESFLQEYITLMYKCEENPSALQDFIDEYAIIVLDEAHENSVVNELIMYIFKYHPRKYEYTKTLFNILSATIQPVEYTRYLFKSPKLNEHIYKNIFTELDKLSNFYIEVEGQNYDVPRNYVPCENIIDGIIDAIYDIITKGSADTYNNRDIIVFVTGQKEIKLVTDGIKMQKWYNSNDYEIIPIHRGQSEESVAAYKLKYEDVHTTKRRIHVSTNKAETGVTLENTKYIIDTGYRKLNFYDFRVNSDTEIICAISQNNALQRIGRVGRKNEGVAYLLYSEEFYNSLAKNDPSALLTENYEMYYRHMYELQYHLCGKDNTHTIDFLLVANNGGKPALHWETTMNYNAAQIFYGFGDRDSDAYKFAREHFLQNWQIALIQNSIKYGCVNEILIYLTAIEIPFKNYFIPKNDSLQFFGTILPKIMFFANVAKLDYYPEMHNLPFPNSIEVSAAFKMGNYDLAKKIDPYKNYTNEEKTDNDIDYSIGKCYKGLVNENTIQILKKQGVPDDDIPLILLKFKKDFAGYCEKFAKYNLNNKINWQMLYLCFKEILCNNIAINYYNTIPQGTSATDNSLKSKNLFILANDTLCKINDQVLVTHKFLAHNLTIDKVYYTTTKIINNVQEFADIL
jgi:hypothetical protein